MNATYSTNFKKDEERGNLDWKTKDSSQILRNCVHLKDFILEIKNTNFSKGCELNTELVEELKEKVKNCDLTKQQINLLYYCIRVLNLAIEDKLIINDWYLGLVLFLIQLPISPNFTENSGITKLPWEHMLTSNCQQKVHEYINNQGHQTLEVGDKKINLCLSCNTLNPLFEDTELIQYFDELDWNFYLFIIVGWFCFLTVSLLTCTYSKVQLRNTASWRYKQVLFNLIRISLILSMLNSIVIYLS